MSQIAPIDRSSGTIQLDNGLTIPPRATLEELVAQGFVFVRKIALNKASVMLSTQDYPFGGDAAYFSLTLLNGATWLVSFGLASLRDKDPLEQQQANTKFLTYWLGEPSAVKQDGKIVSFDFPWGGVSTAYDPKGGTTSMDLSWKPLVH